MHTYILSLPQFFKSLSDSSSAYLKTTAKDSFFRLDNPIIYSILLLVFIIAVMFIFYKYIIAPMRGHFVLGKKDIKAKQTQLMAAFAELDPDPVFQFDETGKILITNKAGSELCKNIYVVGKNLKELIKEIDQIDLHESIEKGRNIDLISQIDDKYYKFTITGLPEMGIGQIYGSDITDLKLAENKLKAALKKIEDSEKIKSYFLAQMSHEIRSPLTAVLGFNTLIKDEIKEKISPDLEYAFMAIENSSRRLTRTIEQLLNMAQLQTGKYDSKFEKIDLNELVRGLISKYDSEAKSKSLDLYYENLIADAVIFGDKYALNQILLNLIDNAIKYTEKGIVKAVIDRDKNNKIFVSVLDTGIGLLKEYIEDIFKPFTQEVMGYNRPFEGNGLGLALCKKFAELNNADILVSSEKNKGSNFTLIFNE